MKTHNRSSLALSIAAICGLLTLAPSFVEGANLVSNGGFEDNSDLVTNPLIPQAPLTNWAQTEVNLVNDVDGFGTTINYGLAPHGGDIAATFFSDTNSISGSGASIKQTLTTDPTKTYDLSLWLANPIQDNGNLNNQFSVMWGGNLVSLTGANLIEIGVGTMTYQVQGNQTTWFQVTASNLTPTGASTVLEISARNKDWGTLVDDVSVTASGVPDSGTSLGLFGIALAGLVLFQRKTQRGSTAVSGAA